MKRIILFFTVLLLIIIIQPQSILAELATSKDWIGLFEAGSTGNTHSATIGGNSWIYSGSCSITSGQAAVSGNCNVPHPPLTPGAYELRMYANDKEYEDALIDRSKTFWAGLDFITSNLNPTNPNPTTCTYSSSNKTLTVNMRFNPLTVGNTQNLRIHRTTQSGKEMDISPPDGTIQSGSYTDVINNAESSYTYYLLAYDDRGHSAISLNDLKATIQSSSCTISTIAHTPPSTTPPPPSPSPAISCPTGNNAIRLQNSLLSLPDTSRNSLFSTADKCVVDPRATLPQFFIPSFEEMKSVYIDQNKSANVSKPALSSGDKTGDDINSALGSCTTNNCLLYVNGNLTFTNPFTGLTPPTNKAVVVFVEGNLLINTTNQKFDAGDKSSGIVFVVKGNINIGKNMGGDNKPINSFFITFGQFCDSWEESSCSTNYNPIPLTINGSIVSLNPAMTPSFKRSNNTNDSTHPGEIITYQPKYLVILKEIFGRNLNLWSEIQ